ncbi:MAG: DM13 domain-containing protein [Gemmatimonadales bacterium]
MATNKGTLHGAEGHQAGGGFEIHVAGTDRHVRLGSDFKVERGPDVYVVLSRGPKVADGDLYLGKLKRFSGASDYAIPAKADLASYTHLVLWCKKYSVAMGTGPLPARAGDEMAKDAMEKDGKMMKGDKMMKDDKMEKDGESMKDDKAMQPDSAAKP